MPEYKDFKNLILKEVWKKAKNGIDYDELLSAGNLAFVEASQSWKPEKGMFSTHLWYRLRYRLGDVVEESKNRGPFLVDFESTYEDTRNEKQISAKTSLKTGLIVTEEGSGYFAAKMSELSQEAKFVVNLVFTSGVELVDMTAKRVQTSRRTIKEYLQGEGWTIPTITKVFDEIKEVVS